MIFPDFNSKSAEIYNRAKLVMPAGSTRAQPFFPPHLVYVKHANGCHVTDVDNVERVDFVNNQTVTVLGHSHPAIEEALQKQLPKGTSFLLPHESEVDLAEIITSRSDCFDLVRFANSGTEAVMNAMKAARSFTGKPKIAKIEGVYHGSYDYAEVSLDAAPSNWGASTHPHSVPFASATPQGVMDDVVVIPFNDAKKAKTILEKNVADIAAIIVDLVPTRCAGTKMNTEFIEMLSEFRKSSGCLIISDEVVCFRLHEGGAHTLMGLQPDLTTLGKVVGGGMPIGVIAGTHDVMQVFNNTKGKPPTPHSGTFTANPLSMVAGAAALRNFVQSDIDRLNALGNTLRKNVNEAFKIADVPGQATHEGSLFIIHFSDSRFTDYRSWQVSQTPYAVELMMNFFHKLLNHGILFSPMGLGSLSTPMENKHIDQFAEAALTALRELKEDGIFNA